MPFEINDDTGALFKNDKRGNEKAPDYSGSCKVNGTEMRMAAWIKKDRNNKTYLSFAFSEPLKKDEARAAEPDDHNGGGDDLDSDSIPF